MTDATHPGHAGASHAELRAQAVELRLHGLLAHWDELMGQAQTEQRVRQWLGWESVERAQRSLERRLREAHLGRFKPLADFDWSWPKHCDRTAIEELMSLQFLADASSVVLFGTNGVGKTMVALNIAHQAVLQGHTALFTTAGQMLGELAALDSDSALRRRLQHYTAQRSVSVLADEQRVRIFDGITELANHPRSFDRHQVIEQSAHLQALVEHKGRARAQRACDALAQVAPAATQLLQMAALRGHNLGSITAALLRLLDQYGAASLQAAVLEAIARDVPHPNAVRLALERARERTGRAVPLALALPEHVARRDAPMRPQSLACYDRRYDPPKDTDDD